MLRGLEPELRRLGDRRDRGRRRGLPRPGDPALHRGASARTVFSSPIEAWYGQISPDGSLVSVDTTDHNPGVRRPALTVIDTAHARDGRVLDDLPAGPIRADPLLVGARRRPRLAGVHRAHRLRPPAIWNPITGERGGLRPRRPGRRGDAARLACPGSGGVLAVHVAGRLHRLLRCRRATLRDVDVVSEGRGSFADPDVADTHAFISQSYFEPDGAVVAVRLAWASRCTCVESRRPGEEPALVDRPPAVPPGTPVHARRWSTAATALACSSGGRAAGAVSRGTVLEVHGGPTW